MVKVIEGELFETVRSRGVAMNTVFGLTALSFGALNLGSYVDQCKTAHAVRNCICCCVHDAKLHTFFADH